MTRGIIIAGVVLLAGCADPMTHMDGIWPTAGYAQRKNLNSQAIAYQGRGSHPGGDGSRAADVMRRYQRRGPSESPATAEAGGAGPAAAPAAEGLAAAAMAGSLGE